MKKTAFFFFDSMLQQIKKNETGSKFLFNGKKFSALLAQIYALIDRPVIKAGSQLSTYSLFVAIYGIIGNFRLFFLLLGVHKTRNFSSGFWFHFSYHVMIE